ncbi:MAG: serine/threonine protein kinase [Actinobacteria bacterium BACL4 MAG-120820-bin23]|nr:MAG: serine/threonine protein kinase [Actinobacteria bacterium BACL4 MAG-121022-bin9]KRO50364.1 MAG: serine/threonine protein kinase [Actinobacteria bacterium BACL4 MAG-120820-bin23]KRO77243.1 MAG: serine/threonine protein kinase [Actinobacteria bacterium BACL4 MAG-120920-bin74]KRO92928.1 MAG: serine/threonine protein kinase [Actinobacteria bacterium BACL4 MAG-120507-bin0]
MADLTGELIDNRYLLQRLIASGGMASIYSALDTRLDRPVAVKIMHAHLANDEAFVSRFIKEAKATAALSHPNIVSIQDQGWNQGGPPAVFIVMELVEGTTLRDLLNESSPLSIEQAFQIINPVLSALSAAHKIGIIHRDIKPENILISRDGRIKVADFGLARNTSMAQTMTAESSVILGSVSYLSPEQVQRGVADSRSDIYAMGILIFEMLTGSKPYDGETPIQIAYRHVNDRIPELVKIKSDIPKNLSDLIFSATSPNPDLRPRDAEELLNSMRQIQVELDPKRRQMSLELDIPPLATKPSKRNKVSVASAFEGLKEKTTQLISANSSITKKTEDSVSTKRRKVSRRVKRNRIIASLILVSVIFGVFRWFDNGRIAVPSLVGLSKSEASTVLSQLGLRTEIAEEIFSEDIDKGKIISTKPGGGGKVSPDGVVGLVVSKGQERILLTALKGTTPDIASQKIADLGLSVGEIIENFDSVVEAGFVIGTNPKEQTPVKRGSIVNIIVSKGIEKVSLSSYLGKGGEQALSELTESGFDVEIEYKFSENIFRGQVISQSPEGSNSIEKGSKILLAVSKGPEFVFVPNVLGKSKNSATLDLENLGLRVAIKGSGKVNNISPAIGSKVKQGALITLTLR